MDQLSYVCGETDTPSRRWETYPVLTPLLELTLLIAFWLVLQTSQRDRVTPGRSGFIACTAGVFCWSLGILLEVEGSVPASWPDRIVYLGVMVVPAMWLTLALQVAGADLPRRRPWLPVALVLPQVPLYAVLLTENGIAWFERAGADGATELGVLWWVSAIYAWGLALLGSGVLLSSAVRSVGDHRRARRFALALVALGPLVGNWGYAATGFQGPDPTPVMLCAALVVLRSALFAGGLLSGLPASQHDLLDALPIAVLLTDQQGTVIAANRAAEARLGIDRRDVLWRSLEAVVGDSQEDGYADTWPIVAAGRETGRVVFFDPIQQTRVGEGAA